MRPGAGSDASSTLSNLKSELFSLLEDTPSIKRGQSLSNDEQAQLERVIRELQAKNPVGNANESPELPGKWQLICTFKPGANVSFTDFDSWRKYLTGKGPSPIQALVTGNTRQVNGVYQLLDLEDKMRFENIVQFSDGVFLNITAFVVDQPNDSLIRFRFDEGNFLFKRSPIDGKPFSSPVSVPYPVPFKLLSLFGDETLGSLDTVYLDKDVRVSMGNKGSYFVFKRAKKLPTEADEAAGGEAIIDEDEIPTTLPADSAAATKLPVIICPAQFAVSEDYDELIQRLAARGHRGVYTADLSRPEWLRILPATLSSDYWQGTLKPGKALQFYYEAIDRAFAKAKKTHPGVKMNFIGHSIGGWIMRSWLTERLSEEEQQAYVASVTTLGTPHNPPPEGTIWTQFDQTRGLLKFVNQQSPGACIDGAQYVCVVGNATRGNVGSPSSLEALESTVAFVSYLPLCGNGNSDGDGIVPIETGLLEDEKVRRIIIDGAKHTGFLPSPGNSIKAPDDWYWYGAEECVDEWAHVLL